jgi:hypothetical protein
MYYGPAEGNGGLRVEDVAKRARRIAERVWSNQVTGDTLDLERHPSWFHSFQKLGWRSDKPIVAICAGWQSGKTVFLPPWLAREIQRCGPGDYGAFSSTFKLLDRKFLPELKKEFRDLAIYKVSDKQFHFTEAGSRKIWGDDWNGDPTIIQLGCAEIPESIESATMKAAVWDEPGQRLVPKASFETVQSRLMANRGRLALASRPYESGWYEELVNEGLSDPDGHIEVVNFPSWANPVNPPIDDPYWGRIRSKMPTWKFTVYYEGRFTRPLGLIYDCFDYDRDTCDDIVPIPEHWKIYPGVDFGPVNTAGILIAEDPYTKELFGVGEYHKGYKRTVSEHVKELKGQHKCSVGAGGSHQESGWREASAAAGLYLDEPPETNVDVQIQCVYEQLATHNLRFFRKACERTIADIQVYSREVDDNGEVQDEIADKAKWHLMDALRYIITKLRPPVAQTKHGTTHIPTSTPPHVLSPNQAHVPQRPNWNLTGR